MKSTEHLKKLREATVADLQNQENDIKEQMFRLRFQWSMGQTETLNKMRQLRKDRARMLTIIREKQKEK